MAIPTPELSTTFWFLVIDGELWFTYTITMSRRDLIRTIYDEIQALNQEIDIKIIRGYPYRQESKRHKFLTAQLNSLMSEQSRPWYQKASQVIATFMF